MFACLYSAPLSTGYIQDMRHSNTQVTSSYSDHLLKTLPTTVLTLQPTREYSSSITPTAVENPCQKQLITQQEYKYISQGVFGAAQKQCSVFE
jgi:hypothetical protein